MKVFISMPMNGRSDKQVSRYFNKYANNIYEEYGEDTEILDSIFDLPKGSSPILYLAKSIELVDKADVVYFAEGWNKSRGCRIENSVARHYGKAIKEEGWS